MSKTKLIIQGGTPLRGCVRVGGAKNASYKLMIAALLSSQESRILNLPDIADVQMVGQIITDLGGKVQNAGNKTLFINPSQIIHGEISEKFGEVSRASTLFIPVLLARIGQVKVPLPGGDKIGKRPLTRHFEGLEKMGAKFNFNSSFIEGKTSGLKGVNYKFSKNTHTGTETLLMAAAMAKGKTILENAAEEPEIDDMIALLNSMGARIRRRAFRVIEIDGVDKLNGTIYQVMPDRNEAVSYACGAIATKGDIVIDNALHQDLGAFLEKLDEIGGGYEIGTYGIRFFYKQPLVSTDVETNIYPGFMTDWQPLWATLMCQARGDSIIHETVMQNRFQYVETLQKMGAKITPVEARVSNPEKTYNFDWADHRETDIHAIKISGPTEFHAGEFEVHDLRAGATTLLAAISGRGQTILHNVEQIDRGYENIDHKLCSLGAKIVRQ